MEEELAKIAGGGSLGVLLTWLSMFLTGRLRDPKSVAHLEADIEAKNAELDKKDKQIAEKDAYIKKLVADQSEQNEEIRRTMIPNLVQQLFLIVGTKAQKDGTNE